MLNLYRITTTKSVNSQKPYWKMYKTEIVVCLSSTILLNGNHENSLEITFKIGTKKSEAKQLS